MAGRGFLAGDESHIPALIRWLGAGRIAARVTTLH
jgi:hypothetical protein